MTSLAPQLPASTAVLVIDMQNDNLHPDGAFAWSGAAAYAASQDVVRNTRTVLDAARASGLAVFHNRIVVYPGRTYGGSNAPIFRMLGPESLKVGTWGAALVDGLDVVPPGRAGAPLEHRSAHDVRSLTAVG